MASQDSGIVATSQGNQPPQVQSSAKEQGSVATQPKKTKKNKTSAVEQRVHPQRDNRGTQTYLNKVFTHEVDELGPNLYAAGQAVDTQRSSADNAIPKPPVVPGRPFARLYPPTPNFNVADPSFARQLTKSFEESRAGLKKLKKQKQKAIVKTVNW